MWHSIAHSYGSTVTYALMLNCVCHNNMLIMGCTGAKCQTFYSPFYSPYNFTIAFRHAAILIHWNRATFRQSFTTKNVAFFIHFNEGGRLTQWALAPWGFWQNNKDSCREKVEAGF